jgi:uncharacterized protein HemY
MQTYLFSTLGEIKLSQDDLAAAESYLYQGLRLAERFGIAERVAGIRATLGRLALKRGEPAKAVDWFNQSLEQADTLGTRRLSVQVRLWLAPLIDPHLARLHLEEARRLAQASQRVFLPQIEEMLNNR